MCHLCHYVGRVASLAKVHRLDGELRVSHGWQGLWCRYVWLNGAGVCLMALFKKSVACRLR